MSTTTFDVEAARARFSSLRSGFAFLDAPGGTQVPDEVGDAIAARAPRRVGQPRRAVRNRPRRGGDPRGREGGCGTVPRLLPGRGRLQHEHDDAELRRHPRRRPRLPAGRRDPDDGARPRRRRRPLGRARRRQGHEGGRRARDRRAHDRLRRPRVEALRPDAGGRLRTRLERDRLGRRCPADLPPRPRRRRALVDRRRPLRSPRAARRDRARLRRAPLLALQVLRPAPRDGLPPHRGRRELAPLQGAPVVVEDRSAGASRRERSPTSSSRASRRRSPTSTRSAASRRCATTSASSASGSSPASRARSRSTARRRWKAACRRSC